MKKLISVLLALLMLTSLFGCAAKQPAADENVSEENTVSENTTLPSSDGAEVVLLMAEGGSVDDRSFGSASWAGIVEFCKETGHTYTYYQAKDNTVESQMAICDAAVKGGAKIVLCATDAMKVASLEMAQTYPDIQFLLMDAEPQTTSGEIIVPENLLAVTFSAEQSGFLAGYAIVKEGYKKLGFMGGQAVPGVLQYGYGFIAGADAAAKELGIEDVEIKYNYAGNFQSTPENQARAASWYQSGTEIIFACGGMLYGSVFAAAEQNGGYGIGVDVDQSAESDIVITSALKDVGRVVSNTLYLWEDGKFPGGQDERQGCAEGACGLPMETSRFQNFSQTDYDALVDRIANNTDGFADTIPNNADYDEPTQIPVRMVTIDYVE